MKKFFGFLFATLCGCIVLTACDFGLCKDGECKDESDTTVDTTCNCATNEVCNADGQCVPKPDCTEDSDCDTGLQCVNEKCVECTADWECGDGMVCKSGFCEVCGGCPKECLTNADCKSAIKVCNSKGVCELGVGKCQFDSDCPDSYCCKASDVGTDIGCFEANSCAEKMYLM